MYNDRNTKVNKVDYRNFLSIVLTFNRKGDKMKRLRKKAAGKIALYHSTSAQTLLQIADSGEILPGGYIGNKNKYMNNGKLVGGMDEGGVYLFRDEKMGLTDTFAGNAGRNQDETKMNFPIVIEVYVDTDALTADYDDAANMLNGGNIKDLRGTKGLLDAESPDKENYWEKSLDATGHVVHQGPINVSEIQSVYINANEFELSVGSDFHQLYMDSIVDHGYAQEFLSKEYGLDEDGGGTLSFDKAIEAIRALNTSIDQLKEESNAKAMDWMKDYEVEDKSNTASKNKLRKLIKNV